MVLVFMSALGSFSAPYIFGGGARVLATQILVSKVTGRPRPFFVQYSVLNACNASCVSCNSPHRADAPLTMIEFTDLECPFCRQYAATGFEEIRKAWIDTGRLRYLARDLPIDSHVHSLMAARAARCAGDQKRFWEMRTTLMKNANLLSPEFIGKTAEGLKLDSWRMRPATSAGSRPFRRDSSRSASS